MREFNSRDGRTLRAPIANLCRMDDQKKNEVRDLSPVVIRAKWNGLGPDGACVLKMLLPVFLFSFFFLSFFRSFFLSFCFFLLFFFFFILL